MKLVKENINGLLHAHLMTAKQDLKIFVRKARSNRGFMIREILFRGKRKDNNEWVYGYYSPLNFPIFGNQGHFINEDGYKAVEIKLETLGQFTGLVDRYDKKIFDGDIVNIVTGINGYTSTYHSAIHEVKYIAEGGIAVFLPFDNSGIVEVEVIGNIYDNNELLEND